MLFFSNSTIYELNKLFRQAISLFYSASYGSLQFSLKKLLEGGYIEIINQEASGRKKKIYGITETGRALFLDWMLQTEIRPDHIDSIALTKVYFLGIIQKNSDKKAILMQIIEAYAIQEKTLEQIESEISLLDIDSSLKSNFNFHVATLNYGITMQHHAKQWYINLLNTIPDED